MIFMSDEERFRAELECRGIVDGRLIDGKPRELPKYDKQPFRWDKIEHLQEGFVKVCEHFTLDEGEELYLGKGLKANTRYS